MVIRRWCRWYDSRSANAVTPKLMPKIIFPYFLCKQKRKASKIKPCCMRASHYSLPSFRCCGITLPCCRIALPQSTRSRIPYRDETTAKQAVRPQVDLETSGVCPWEEDLGIIPACLPFLPPAEPPSPPTAIVTSTAGNATAATDGSCEPVDETADAAAARAAHGAKLKAAPSAAEVLARRISEELQRPGSPKWQAAASGSSSQPDFDACSDASASSSNGNGAAALKPAAQRSGGRRGSGGGAASGGPALPSSRSAPARSMSITHGGPAQLRTAVSQQSVSATGAHGAVQVVRLDRHLSACNKFVALRGMPFARRIRYTTTATVKTLYCAVQLSGIQTRVF